MGKAKRAIMNKIKDRRILELEETLRTLIGFVDGLTYRQLEFVPGLFEATRRARRNLPDDHITIEQRTKLSDYFVRCASARDV